MRYQAGGGVTSAADVDALLSCGMARVIVRPAAAAAAGGLAGLARRFGADRLALALDVVGGHPAGAVRAAGLDRAEALALARAAAEAGIRTVIYTDLEREGRLGGADVGSAAALAAGAGVEVVVSGGVHALDELARIRAAGLAGAVVGRALYEGRFTLSEALACSAS
jgi:phosphoribosylformimino-5-aminoimidazole carboxamide ribotide isomerase